MPPDPITGGLIGWACGELANKGLSHLLESSEFTREIDRAVRKWAGSMHGQMDVDPGALFGTVHSGGASEGEHYRVVQAKLLKSQWPDKDQWHRAFLERWQHVRLTVEEPQAFFAQQELRASAELETLAEAVYGVCKRNDRIFKSAVISKLDELIKQPSVITEPSSESDPIGPADFAQSEDEESLFGEDTLSNPCCGEEEFVHLLSDYSDNLPIEHRQDHLNSIVASAWKVIVDRPSIAARLMDNETMAKSTLSQLIVPLCKTACYHSISPDELRGFFDLLEDSTYFGSDSHRNNSRVLIARMVRFLFYDKRHQPEILKSAEFKREISHLANKGEMFWDEFFVDLYLRHLCDYIFIDREFLVIIRPSYERYRCEHKNKPLVQLWRLISRPVEASQQYLKNELFELISDVARKCEDIVECRWCVSAFQRIIPLYYTSEEELDYVDLIRALIREFSLSLRSKHPQLQFIYLKALLGTFVHTKDPKFIGVFEKEFIKSCEGLLLSQKSHLQLEYASCLYACCQFLNRDDMSELHFDQMVSSETRLLDRLLFRNEHLNHSYDLQRARLSSLGDKTSLRKWLGRYTLTLYRLYADRLVQENHLRVLQFRASTRVYHNRSQFGKSVLASLERYIGSESDYPASFFAKSTAAFAFVPHKKNIELVRKYVAKGMQANEYSVLRNARHIAQCLYSCYYYGELSNRAEVEDFADLLAGKTNIGKSVPRLHWAYYAGIKYPGRKVERDFLDDLWKDSKTMTRKIYQLALRLDEKVEVIFPDSVLTLIRSHVSYGCLFAKILHEELTNPEVWNLFGTTVFNNLAESDADSLEKAAHFYAFAKLFVRKRKDYDQKYCYNYIRCKALAYKAAGLQPEDFYIRDTAFYLRRPGSWSFAYKQDCAGHYFDLLKTWWDSLSDERRKFVGQELSQVDWIRKELNYRNLNYLE